MSNTLFKKEWRKCSVCNKRIGWLFCKVCTKRIDKECEKEFKIKGLTINSLGAYELIQNVIKRLKKKYER